MTQTKFREKCNNIPKVFTESAVIIREKWKNVKKYTWYDMRELETITKQQTLKQVQDIIEKLTTNKYGTKNYYASIEVKELKQQLNKQMQKR